MGEVCSIILCILMLMFSIMFLFVSKFVMIKIARKEDNFNENDIYACQIFDILGLIFFYLFMNWY